MKFYLRNQHMSRVAPGRGANMELEGKLATKQVSINVGRRTIEHRQTTTPTQKSCYSISIFNRPQGMKSPRSKKFHPGLVLTPGMTNAEKLAAYDARPSILKALDALTFPALIFIFVGNVQGPT